MPVKWTPELDSIVLHSVFEEYNVTVSKSLCIKIAERLKAVGMDTTPKAIEGRLYGWKKKNAPSTTPSGTPAKTAAPKAPKTPTSRSKMVPKKKKNMSVASSDESPDDTLSPKSPSAGRGKRARKASYAESDGEEVEAIELDYMPMGKRIKIEPKDDDEGFGGGEDGDVEV